MAYTYDVSGWEGDDPKVLRSKNYDKNDGITRYLSRASTTKNRMEGRALEAPSWQIISSRRQPLEGSRIKR